MRMTKLTTILTAIFFLVLSIVGFIVSNTTAAIGYMIIANLYIATTIILNELDKYLDK